MSLSPAERETVLQIDDESNKWTITTYQSKMVTRLRKAGFEPAYIDSFGGYHYRDIDFNRVSFRNESKRRELTEEQREDVAKRFRKARESRSE